MQTLDGSFSNLLRRAGLSRDEAASKLSVSPQTIHNWCRGRYPIGPSQLQRIAELLEETDIPHSQISAFVHASLETHGLTSKFLQSGDVGDHNRIIISVWRLSKTSMLSTFASSCRRALVNLGFNCMVIDCDGSHGSVRDSIDLALSTGAIGMVLLVPGFLPNPEDDLAELTHALTTRQVPIVFGQYCPSPERLPAGTGAVGYDSRAVASVAADVLETNGHRTVSAVFGGYGSNDHPLLRALAMELERREIDLAYTVWRQGRSSIANDLGPAIRSTSAILVDSPIGSSIVAQTLGELGLRWPKDISVLGIGLPDSLTQLRSKPLTVLEIPIARIGQEAAHLMAQLIKVWDLPLERRSVFYGKDVLSVHAKQTGSVGLAHTPVG